MDVKDSMLVGRELIEAALLKKEIQSWLDFFEHRHYCCSFAIISR
jgi:hypothetical protein